MDVPGADGLAESSHVGPGAEIQALGKLLAERDDQLQDLTDPIRELQAGIRLPGSCRNARTRSRPGWPNRCVETGKRRKGRCPRCRNPSLHRRGAGVASGACPRARDTGAGRRTPSAMSCSAPGKSPGFRRSGGFQTASGMWRRCRRNCRSRAIPARRRTKSGAMPVDMRDRVFPSLSSKSGHVEELFSHYARIRKVAGIRFWFHGLRNAFITVGKRELMLPSSLTKRLVDHAQPSDVTVGYAADLTAGQLREPAQRIADRINELMETAGSQETATAP